MLLVNHVPDVINPKAAWSCAAVRRPSVSFFKVPLFSQSHVLGSVTSSVPLTYCPCSVFSLWLLNLLRLTLSFSTHDYYYGSTNVWMPRLLLLLVIYLFKLSQAHKVYFAWSIISLGASNNKFLNWGSKGVLSWVPKGTKPSSTVQLFPIESFSGSLQVWW